MNYNDLFHGIFQFWDLNVMVLMTGWNCIDLCRVLNEKKSWQVQMNLNCFLPNTSSTFLSYTKSDKVIIKTGVLG